MEGFVAPISRGFVILFVTCLAAAGLAFFVMTYFARIPEARPYAYSLGSFAVAQILTLVVVRICFILLSSSFKLTSKES